MSLDLGVEDLGEPHVELQVEIVRPFPVGNVQIWLLKRDLAAKYEAKVFSRLTVSPDVLALLVLPICEVLRNLPYVFFFEHALIEKCILI